MNNILFIFLSTSSTLYKYIFTIINKAGMKRSNFSKFPILLFLYDYFKKNIKDNAYK